MTCYGQYELILDVFDVTFPGERVGYVGGILGIDDLFLARIL